jgi:pyrroline-5-carboxylate reductase
MADIVVLSVKPQVLPAVLTELRGCILPQALVLSIVAGRTMATIAAGLEHTAIVRAMPNTPAQIGEGMTVWTATPDVNQEQQAQAQAILRAMGQEIYVAEERALDMATAVSGTGPTYVFLMMEAMIDAAVHMGFSRRVAKALVLQTVLGSVLFAGQSSKHLADLRNMVTSPGGTSADAIRHCCGTGTNWRRAACAPSSPRPSGPPIRSRSCWASRTTASPPRNGNCLWMKVDGQDIQSQQHRCHRGL